MPDEKKELEDVDSGWDDEDDDEEEDEDEDLDAGWDEAEGVEGQAASGPVKRGANRPPPRVLTPEEREARAARVEARKQRLRGKAAEKAERRKAKASAAASKQKRSAPRERVARSSAPPKAKVEPRPEPVADEGGAHDDDAEIRAEPRVSRNPAGTRAAPPWLNGRTLAIAVIVLLVGGAIAFVLTRR